MQSLICKPYTLFTGFLCCLLMLGPRDIIAQTYTVSQTGTYLLEIESPTIFSLNGDTVTQIPIGFDFSFFGVTYTDCYVGGDGFITFGEDPGSYCCGQELPDPDPANNLIAVAWTNTDFSSGHYEIFGDAPFRRLVITFDLRNPCDETYYGQVKLYETSNVIEIHTQQWDQDQCQGWNATQGLENLDGSEAILVPGRNYNNTWHIAYGEEDFVSFSPNVSTAYILSQSGLFNIEINSPTSFDVYTDDATQIPIGFNFNFYGVPYSDCWVSGDGFISFGAYPGGGCCGQTIPTSGTPNNLIAVAWTNMDSSTAHYEIFGDAPYRRLVITLELANTCNDPYSGQVKLYETTNVIEIHTSQWYQDPCPGQYSTMGVENADGTQATVVPGRNFTDTWHIQSGDDDIASFTPVSYNNVIYTVEQTNDYNLESESPIEFFVYEDGLIQIGLGFDFSFFGTSYNECFVNQNGFISFGDYSGNGCCEGQLIPNADGPNNLIAPCWMDAVTDHCCDAGNAYNIFNYETLGTEPNRRFILTFTLPENCGQYYHGQIKLFESTNIIEIHTDHWQQYNPTCSNATQGIENVTGTSAYYAPGRNSNVDWSVMMGDDDVVRFIPSYELPPADAGVDVVIEDGFCTGPQMMRANIRNFGTPVIDSVMINWEWEGVLQTPIQFVGSLPAGNDTLINLGIQSVISGENHDLRAWTSLPNGNPDIINTNDTLSATIHSALAGSFTIGGSSPDYVSFTAAIADLSSIGICDTVIMNVRPGTYNEQITIPFIAGSDGKKIIFQAENGDSTSVILQYNATLATANYVIRFDSAQNVKISHMTLNALGINFARAIEFKDFTHDNVIEHCAIKGRNAVVSTTAFACIYSDAFNSNNSINHNRIENGSYGFYHQYDAGGGGSSTPPDSIRLDSNVFVDFYYKAIYVNQTKAIHIHNNLIQSSKSGVRGIEVVNDGDAMTVSNNNIYLTIGNAGMWLENIFPPTGKRARIFNNMINVTGNAAFAGVGIYNCGRTSFYHNSIRTEDPDGSYTFHFQSGIGTQDSVYNNIIANTGNGPVVYAATNYLFNSLDYNDYYTTSPLFGGGFISSTFDVANLTQWQLVTNLDAHSLNINPLYLSNTNLHTTNHLLNGAGTPLLSTIQDIDGNTRNSTNPDIGADEFTPVGTDAGITKILSPTLTCDAEQNIEIVLSNLGADTLHQVTIKWILNGIAQPDVSYNQNLLPEGDTAHVILSVHGFSNQPDTLKIWTSMPNGGIDSQHSNDTISYRFRLPLNGIYTIGGSNPDFTTFKKAVDDLNYFHTCGPVVFRFRDGTYTDQVVIDSIPTTSAVNTVTFESESLDSSAVFIKFNLIFASSNHNNVTLNGSDYITFRYLGFQALTDVNLATIEARNNATHLTFSHCRFEGAPFNTFTNYIFRSLSGLGTQSYITFDQNYFLNATYGIAMYNTSAATDFHITNNHFVNQVAKAIDIINTKNLYIQNNKVESNASNNYTGIDLDGSYVKTEISGNYIKTNNGNGLYLNSSTGDAKVFNNMVSVGGFAIGMNFWNCVNTRISFNSSRATGTGHGIEFGGGDSIQLKNNIFMSNSGRVISSFNPPVHVIFDYNDLYSVTGPIGYWNDVTYSTMAAWQAVGFDTNSINVDPQFVSVTDLHVLADTLDGAGIPIAGINVDFDNNPRNATNPDIGADEIGANSNDAGVFAILPEMPFARGIQDVKAVIRNYGGDTITSAQIHWKLNNVTQTTFNYSGSLPTLQQDTVILGQLNFDLSTPYLFKSWTALPNGVADLYNINDTLTTNTRYPAVSDTLTIGGVAPDLANFTSALTALSLGGVLDSVHFQLRNGTYHTVFTIPQTLGMNCNTPIVFESESGNPADVIWDNASLSNHTLVINGADGLRFKNLTIRTVLPAFHAVVFTNGANCNKFLGCVIEGVATTSTSLTQVTILSYDTYNNDVEFIGNTIRNGSYGIYWFGAYNSSTGARIENNIFENSYYCGLTMSRLIAPVVHHNTISSNTAYSYPYGMQIIECSLNTKVTANQVLFSGKRGVGIYLAYIYGNASQRNLIANNFVILGNSSSSYGIHQITSNFSNIYNNTVRLTGGNTTGFPYLRQYSMNINLKDNIFDNRAGGVAMYLETNEGPLTSDYNDLYSTGTNLVYYNGTNYPNLASWHSSGFDIHSISEDPMYVNATGFEITGAALNAAGIPLPEVSVDIQNQPRDTLTPDIGCDEIALFDNDVGILSINYPKEPFPSGVNTVFIKFVNNGQDTLTSMQVDWEVDGIPQPTYAWTGLLPSAGTYDSLDIGEFNFAPYQAYEIKAWVSLPNTFEDELASNDTLEVSDLYPGLLGTYTIGGMNPDFNSLTAAVDILNLGGAAGPVTFNIRTGTYLETLILNDYPGSDCNTPVIFQSETGDSTTVTITNLGIDDNTITLNGTDGVIFKKLTIVSVNPAFKNVITYYNGAHCNQFLNNHIEGLEGTSTNSTDAVIYSGNSLDTANVFNHNRIEHGSMAFYLEGNGEITNTQILNNFLDHNYYIGIYGLAETGIHISHNNIEAGPYSSYMGIYLLVCGATNVEANTIHANTANRLMRFDNCVATTNARGRIVNNFMSSGGTTSTEGLMILNSQHYDIFHNTINIKSSTLSYALYCDNDISLNLLNNIISNKGTGYAVLANNQTSFNSDYNDFYATGSFGIWNGAGKANLSAWQSATGQDAHSLSVNPQFISDVDLHITNILLNGTGQTIASVTHDIESDLRTNPPDIGADEFVPSIPHDAGVFSYTGPNAPFSTGVHPVKVVLKNYGSQTLTSADVRWLVNGIEQPLHHWTGSLLPAADTIVTVGNYSFGPHLKHNLIFWSQSPNGIPDSTHVNDTLYVNDLYPALSGSYTVGGVLPDFNLFSQLEDALNKGGILGDVYFNIRDGIYPVQFAVLDFPRGAYNQKVYFQSEARDSNLVTLVKNFYEPTKNYTIRLSNAHNIIIRDLTLSSNQGRVVDIDNGSSVIQVNNCRLVGPQLNYNSGTYMLLYSGSTSEDTLYIANNQFDYGDNGIFMVGSGGALEKNVSILNNYFNNCYYRSIHVEYDNGLMVKGNTIFNNRSVHEGITIFAANETKEISNNDIRILSGGNHGLLMQYVTGTSAFPTLIANNYILVKNWTNNVVGLYHLNGDYNHFYYNTVRVENTGSGSIAFADNASNNHIHLRNCNFANYSGGVAMYNLWLTGFNTNTMDYCNLFTTGEDLARYYYYYSDLAELQAGNNQNQHSQSAEPLFSTEDPDVFQAALNGTAIPISGITTDIDGTPRNATTPDIGVKEFTLLTHNIGAKLLVTPATYCGLSNAEAITMKVQNYGASTETGFNVAYKLDASGWIVENVGALSVVPGGTLNYTFTTTENLSQVGTYQFGLYTALTTEEDIHNDTILDIEVEHIPALVSPVTNMIPTDGTMNLESSVSLSWAPAPNANRYDIYLWPDGQTEPSTPQVSNLTQINTLYSSLTYGQKYNWRIVAKNVCNQMVNGPVQQFTIRKLPEMVVDTVVAPPTAFSGQTIQVQWVTKNNGPGATQSVLWSDAVFLSTDATLNTSFDTYIGAVQNLTALDSGMAYTHSGTFMVPQGFSGNYYVFVYADRWNSISEISNNNNWRRNVSPMMVSLTPSPDLIVQSVTTPTTVFSGANMPVTYHVKNDGLGPVLLNSTWSDRILIGQDPLNAIGQNIGSVGRSFELLPDSTYMVTENVILPNAISGTYYVHVTADNQNAIYEFGAEDNNSNASLPIDVILAPPADLIVSEINYPDTVSNNELVYFNWEIDNQGAGVADAQYWLDQSYLSLSPVYNPNFMIPFTYGYKSGPVIPFSSYTLSPGAFIPNYLSGYYYIYLFTDKNNDVFENNSDGNNIYKSPTQIFVANADLHDITLTAPDTTVFGSTISLSWNTVNAGPGKIINRYMNYKIFLSTQDTLNPQSILLFQTINYYNNYLVEDTIARSASIQLPPGYTGQYFLLIKVDASENIFEGAHENNNLSSTPIFLQPGPAPDIITTLITVSDTIVAGMSSQIAYQLMNTGNAMVSQSWNDKVYMSFDSTWNPMNAIELKNANQPAGLSPGLSRSTDLPVIIPHNTTENVYYIYVVNDHNNIVFEGTPGELNNVKRSNSLYIKAAPPVDLSLDSISITSGNSIYTGVSYPFQWSTKNTGISSTLTGTWSDRIYLSQDTIYQAGVDILIGDHASTGSLLMPGQSRFRQVSLKIPNGLSGNFYIIGITDALDVHFDVDRDNNINKVRDLNGVPRLFTVVLSPYPELTITLFNTPASGIAGQPVQVIYTIKNNGNGNASGWLDKMYLSADNLINNQDLILLSNTRSTVSAGQSINDTVDVQIPVGYFGNYILILETDANNQLYEHNGENNNILTRSINIINPPPSDLQVSSVIVPVSVIAGDNINISWTTNNVGNNPASGVFREVVYISSDTTWNTQDVVFGIKDQSIYLPPAGHIDQELTDNVTGVATGDYYAIVQTDARQNFNESNETNNFTASTDIMNVDVKTLFLDSLTADTLQNNLELYYKIVVGPDLDGETILLDLKGDSIYGLNELYVKYNQMPTRADFDFGFDHPFQSDQRIILPNVQPGTYYILTYGFTLDNSVQDITLYARVIDYEILSLSPRQGIQNTQVTLKITGSKLNNTVDWRLRQNEPWFSRDAVSSLIVDDNLAFVTFDLTGVAVDTYAVDLIKPDSSLAFIEDFMVVADGSQPKLQINAQLPGGVPGRPVPVQIVLTFINNGDADVINPSVTVEAPYGNLISMTLEDHQDGIGSPALIVPLVEENGPPGVIRPGASGRIEIYATSGPVAVYGIRLND